MSTDPSWDSTTDLPTGPDGRDAVDDNRSTVAKAAEWASRIMTISLEMVLPGLAGYWIDSMLGSKVVFMFVGFAIGSFIAFKQLMAIAKQGRRNSPSEIHPDRKSGTPKKDNL